MARPGRGWAAVALLELVLLGATGAVLGLGALAAWLAATALAGILVLRWAIAGPPPSAREARRDGSGPAEGWAGGGLLGLAGLLLLLPGLLSDLLGLALLLPAVRRHLLRRLAVAERRTPSGGRIIEGEWWRP